MDDVVVKLTEGGVRTVVTCPAHPWFASTWGHVLRGYSAKRVVALLGSVRHEHADILFSVWLHHLPCTRTAVRRPAWAALLAHAPDDTTRLAWIRRLAKEAPALHAELGLGRPETSAKPRRGAPLQRGCPG